jgi:hypothetical protein
MFAQAGRSSKRVFTDSEEVAKVTRTSLRRRADKALIAASFALAFGLGGFAQSFAGCGGYCEARQTRAICHRAVAIQDLKPHERDAEFEKCKADPMTYPPAELVKDSADGELD